MSHYSINFEKNQAFEIKYKKIIIQKNISDVIEMSYRPKCSIKKITKKYYLVVVSRKHIFGSSKGICDFIEYDGYKYKEFKNHKKEDGIVSYRTLRKKFIDLRYLIANNFVGSDQELFLTLTYRYQTNDSKQVHKDFKKFIQRLNRDPIFKDCALGYINIVEPHASGCWHMHVLLKSTNGSDLRSIFLSFYNDNKQDSKNKHLGQYIEAIWCLGFVNVKTLQSDHIGAYFIAYLSNAEISADDVKKYEAEDDVREAVDPRDGKLKKYIKGNRLKFYKEYMQVYRHSKNILKPKIVTDGSVDKYFIGMRETYNNTTKIALESQKPLYITKKQYKKEKK